LNPGFKVVSQASPLAEDFHLTVAAETPHPGSGADSRPNFLWRADVRA